MLYADVRWWRIAAGQGLATTLANGRERPRIRSRCYTRCYMGNLSIWPTTCLQRPRSERDSDSGHAVRLRTERTPRGR
jgi:hypothetical protein